MEMNYSVHSPMYPMIYISVHLQYARQPSDIKPYTNNKQVQMAESKRKKHIMC